MFKVVILCVFATLIGTSISVLEGGGQKKSDTSHAKIQAEKTLPAKNNFTTCREAKRGFKDNLFCSFQCLG